MRVPKAWTLAGSLLTSATAHERLGQAMRATEKYRFRLVHYQALGE